MNFGDQERRICELIRIGSTVSYNRTSYTILKVGKPTCPRGEPKTDIYVLARALNCGEREFKISFKKPNAHFLENKTSAERAQQIFGSTWHDLVINAAHDLIYQFKETPLIYKRGFGRTQPGSITLGWKFELLNRPSGRLSSRLPLSPAQVLDVYAGTNLSREKMDATVDGECVEKSGIANFMLLVNAESQDCAQSIFKQLVPIEEFCNENPDIYCAFKAHNYRSLESRDDGNRPLGAYVNWIAKNGKLLPVISFDNPLLTKSNEVKEKLLNALDSLNVSSTAELTEAMLDGLEHIVIS